MEEIVHFGLDFICKVGTVNVVASPSGSSWDHSLVEALVVNFDQNRKMFRDTNRVC